jgi:hypothetical protein
MYNRDSGSASGIQVIFCSRLIRCVQTAHEIARHFGVPIIVSKGLALTALAVRESQGLFEFASLRELRDLCPGTLVYSCDEDDRARGENSLPPHIGDKPTEFARMCAALSGPALPHAASVLEIKSPTTTADVELSSPIADFSLFDTPTLKYDHNDWLSPIQTIARQYPQSMIVCHRETIRNFTEVNACWLHLFVHLIKVRFGDLFLKCRRGCDSHIALLLSAHLMKSARVPPLLAPWVGSP